MALEVSQALEGMFQAIMDLRSDALSLGPKASVVFEKAVEEFCREERLPVTIMSLLSGKIAIATRPDYLMVIDPLNAPAPLEREVESLGVSMALVPCRHDGMIVPSESRYGLLGNLVSGSYCVGGLGHGVVYHGVLSRFRKQIAEGSKAISLAQARIYVDSPDGTDNIRGSPILGLIDIVHGAADAYICHSAAADCILGACPLIQEVGGRITDPDGELLP